MSALSRIVAIFSANPTTWHACRPDLTLAT